MSPFSQTQHDSFSSYSYSDYSSITLPLQAFQEIISTSSSQPGSSYSCVLPTLLYSPSSITPANTPSSSQVMSCGCAGSDTSVISSPYGLGDHAHVDHVHNASPACMTVCLVDAPGLSMLHRHPGAWESLYWVYMNPENIATGCF